MSDETTEKHDVPRHERDFNPDLERLYRIPCPQCGETGCSIDYQESVSLHDFEKTRNGWEVKGAAKLIVCIHGLCQNCGKVFDLICREVPVRFPSLRCPKCDNRRFLRCSINTAHIAYDRMEFSATLECEHCGKSKLDQFLYSLLHIKKISISLTGIEIET